MKSTLKFCLVLFLLAALLLTGCTPTPSPADDESGEDTTAFETEDLTTGDEETTGSDETTGGTETDDGTGEDAPMIEGKLPSGRSDTFTCGDGTENIRYAKQTDADFSAACLWFEQDGYTRYCGRTTENTSSATYVKGDAYVTLFHRREWGDLTIGRSASGASKLPPQNEPYEKLRETTVTQPGLSGEGMCEILQLADGSFLIFDSGTSSAGKEIYDELCRLSGKTSDIHIRAWVMTHSHSDHYGGFLSLLSENKYLSALRIDYILYAPINRGVADILLSYNTSWDGIDYYFNDTFPTFVKNRLKGTKLCSVHAGQVFTFADVELQILYTSDMLYIDGIMKNFNNTSIISRVENADGSILMMADSGAEGTNWTLQTYQEELVSDFMQVTHHGMVTHEDQRMMQACRAKTYLWPCSENKFNLYWGLSYTAKQYAILDGENYAHGYGSITRKLSYRGSVAEGSELLSPDITASGNGVAFTETEAKSIQFTVTDASDPYVTIPVSFSTKNYNMLRIRVRCPDYSTSSLSFTSGKQTPFVFNSTNTKKLGPQGAGRNNIVTLLVYLGNGADYTGRVTSLRLDLGEKVGDEITVFSIEAFHLEVDS